MELEDWTAQFHYALAKIWTHFRIFFEKSAKVHCLGFWFWVFGSGRPLKNWIGHGHFFLMSSELNWIKKSHCGFGFYLPDIGEFLCISKISKDK